MLLEILAGRRTVLEGWGRCVRGLHEDVDEGGGENVTAAEHCHGKGGHLVFSAGPGPGRLEDAMNVRVVLMFTALLSGGCKRYWICDEADSARTAELPLRLSQTGLYTDVATGEAAPGVVAYTPRFELWSDGAEKRRWILLPAGEQIDTRNMDEWLFPVGTKIWKEFSLAGVRVETRLLEKRGPKDSDWISLAYVWNAEENDAIAAPLGAVDTRHTDHDVPAAGECAACHGGRRSFVLGFSALQLAATATAGELDLDGLVREGRLSHPPATAPVIPGASVEVAALGYLHANCSHCHNATRPDHDGARCFDPRASYDFTLPIGQLDSVAATPTYRTVVGSVVKPGDAEGSKLVELMSSRGMFRQMPPLASEKVDASGVATIREWIEAL